MPTRTSAAELFRQVPILADLSETELQFLVERAVPRTYAKGELIFTQGDPCAGLFIVERGRVRIFKSSPMDNYCSRCSSLRQESRIGCSH